MMHDEPDPAASAWRHVAEDVLHGLNHALSNRLNALASYAVLLEAGESVDKEQEHPSPNPPPIRAIERDGEREKTEPQCMRTRKPGRPRTATHAKQLRRELALGTGQQDAHCGIGIKSARRRKLVERPVGCIAEQLFCARRIEHPGVRRHH